MRSMTLAAAGALVALASAAQAQAPTPELDACKASGLIAIKEHKPAVKAITIDPDTVSISKTDTMFRLSCKPWPRDPKQMATGKPGRFRG